MTDDRDLRFIRRALELAEQGWGRVQPNPLVGAVVVRGDEIVGEGHHAEWGASHAEVEAIRAAGDRASGAELFLNLEPCHHRGKTPPCSEAIVAAGIRRVVYAMDDPNPEAGGGGEWLRQQGLEVETGIAQDDARELNAIHVAAHRLGRPFLALKFAMSLDGRISEAPGASTRITAGAALRHAHRLRAGHDALIIGIGTALADDPELTVREWEPPRKPPVRVVLDSKLRLPPTARLLETTDAAPLWIFAAEEAATSRADALKERGATLLRVRPSGTGPGLALTEVVATLWARGVRSVLCEGGAGLGSALVSSGLVDRLYLYLAPLLLGDPGVRAFSGSRGDAPREWRLIDRRELDEVTLLALSAGTLAEAAW